MRVRDAPSTMGIRFGHALRHSEREREEARGSESKIIGYVLQIVNEIMLERFSQ